MFYGKQFTELMVQQTAYISRESTSFTLYERRPYKKYRDTLSRGEIDGTQRL